MRKPIGYVQAAMMAGLIAQAPALGGYARSNIEPRPPESDYTPEQKAKKQAEMERLKATQPHLNRKQRRQKARRAVKRTSKG